jgi:hypothetical protein
MPEPHSFAWLLSWRCPARHRTAPVPSLVSYYKVGFRRGPELPLLARFRIAGALELDLETVETAVAKSREEMKDKEQKAPEEEERIWRESFQSHAVVVPERSVPSPIWLAAFCGTDRPLVIPVDKSCHRSTFVRQALNKLPGGRRAKASRRAHRCAGRAHSGGGRRACAGRSLRSCVNCTLWIRRSRAAIEPSPRWPEIKKRRAGS